MLADLGQAVFIKAVFAILSSRGIVVVVEMRGVVPAIDEAREACCVQNQIRGNVELRRGRRFACGCWKLVVAGTGIRGDEQKSEQKSRSPEAIRKEVQEDADNNESHQHDKAYRQMA